MKLFSPMEPSSACSYVATQRGGVALLFEGHRYNKVRDGKDGTVYWRCSRDRQCPGRAVTVNNRVKKSNNKHNHPPEASLLMRNGQVHQTPAALLASQARANAQANALNSTSAGTGTNNNSNSHHHSNQSQAMAAAAAAAAAYASFLQKPTAGLTGSGTGLPASLNAYNNNNNNNHRTPFSSSNNNNNASPSSVTSSSSPSPLNSGTNPFSAFALLQNLATAQQTAQAQHQQNILGAFAGLPEFGARIPGFPAHLNGLFQAQQASTPQQIIRNSGFGQRQQSPLFDPAVAGLPMSLKPDPSSPPPTPTHQHHRHYSMFAKDAFHNNNTLELSPRSLTDSGFPFTLNGRNGHSPSGLDSGPQGANNGQALNLKTDLPNSPSSSSTVAESTEFTNSPPSNNVAAAAFMLQDVFQEAQAAAMAAAFPSLLSETIKYLAVNSGPQMAATLASALGSGVNGKGSGLDFASLTAAMSLAAAAQQGSGDVKKNGKRPHSEVDDEEEDVEDVDDLRSSPTAKNYRASSATQIKHILEPTRFDDEDDNENDSEDKNFEEECDISEEPLNMALNNAQQLLRLIRGLMSRNRTESLAALIVPSDDAHGSEYIAPCDARRAFVSNFTGSAGTAVITQKDARLWTDGRYFLQAGTELDSSCWKLMKDRQPDTPTIGEWLNKSLESGSRVGVDPFTISYVSWNKLEQELSSAGNFLVPTAGNLVDDVWKEKPERPLGQVLPLEMKFTGMNWQDKIAALRTKMTAKGASALVLTALDDCAWLLNMRGSDIEYNPVFFCYVVLTKSQVVLFINNSKLGNEAKVHLMMDKDSMDTGESCTQIQVQPYDAVLDFISTWLNSNSGKIWISDKSSYALVNQIPKPRRIVTGVSPVTLKKAVKNATEVEGMRRAHIKDAVAICELFNWLEEELLDVQYTSAKASPEFRRRNSDTSANSVRSSTGQQVDELMVDAKLEEFRRQQEDYIGRSFASITGSGSNGAIIHYHCSESTNRPVTASEMFLLDCGAQFRDGTTDVTRTIHLGDPTRHERECFTRVVKGHISLASAHFPRLVKGEQLDAFARRSLWDVGLDYNHGTGHGVGSYLNVHEGPSSIANRHVADDPGIVENMIFSNEPGYYEAGKFGIRIESLVVTLKKDLKFNFNDRGYLGFDTITLVPIQTKLLLPELLTKEEIDWINQYHIKCRDVVGDELHRQGREKALLWLIRETQPIA